jgi:hypothetical protein
MAMLSRSLSSSCALAVAASLRSGVIASAEPVHCPEQLQVEQRAVDVPGGMQTCDGAKRHLWVNVQFSDGPPAQQVWLAPDSTAHRGKTFTNR